MATRLETSILINGVWVDAAAPAVAGVLVRDPVQVSHGRANWSSRVETGKATFTLDNRDGRWSPDYPASINFGKWKRNLPVRIGVGSGVSYVTPTGVGADVITTPDVGGTGGATTAPAVASITSSAQTAYTATHTFARPATVNLGDRLLLVAAFTSSSAVPSGGTMDAWTLVYASNLHAFHRWVIYEIEASSTAIATALSGGSVTFTTSLAEKSSAQIYRITGARSGGSGTAWSVSAGTTVGFGTGPDPDSLTVPWGADNQRWLALCTAGNAGPAVTGSPSGYTVGASGNTAADVVLGTAHKAANSATDNPAAFTLGAAANWQAVTFAYRPSATTGTDGALDIPGDIDIRFELQLNSDPVDITKGGRRLRLAHKSSGADGWEVALYDALGFVVASFTWRDSGGASHAITTEGTGAALPLTFRHDRLALRVTLDVDNGASGHTVTWYTSTSIGGTWTQLGSPIVTAGTTSIKTNDAPLRLAGNPGDVTTLPLPGKVYAFQLRNGLGGTIVANPDFTAQAVGATSFTDSATRVWTTGTGGRITNIRWRFHGELASLPVRWSTEGKDVWSPVEASGLFRRLRQGNRRLESALQRAIVRSAASVVQYWPMEEAGDHVAAFGAAIGTAPFVVTGGFPSAASNNDFLAAGPIPTPGNTTWTAIVDPYIGPLEWQIRWLQSIPATFTNGGAEYHYIQVQTTDLTWEVAYRDNAGGQLSVFAYRGSTLIYQSAWTSFNATGKAFRMSFSAQQSGATAKVTLTAQLATSPTGGGFTDTGIVGSAGQVTRIAFNQGADIDPWAIGHVTLQAQETPDSELATEINAYDGEAAGTRIARLCREEGIATRIEGDPTLTEAMGPQRPGSLMGLLEECAATDLGFLHEPRTTVAVGYRTRTSMTGQTVKIALDYAAGHVAASPELDRDDQDFANDVTVTNLTGTTARATLADGTALSVSEPPVGAGRYDATFRVNGQNSRLAALAASRLALTAVNEPRVSKLSLALHHAAPAANPTLVDSILDSSLGDLLTVDNVLAVALGSTQIRQLVQGARDKIGTHEHTIDLLTSPASPWTTPGPITPPPPGHTVTFRTQKTLATSGTAPHVLTALGYTGSTAITRAQLDGILDAWVVSTGGTTRNVTSAATWTTACAAALPGDLIRVTSSFTGDITLRGNKYSIGGANLTASPAGGLPGKPIIATCANGVTVTGTSTASGVGTLDLFNNIHCWLVGFNTSSGLFGIRAMNWGGTAGFPAYRAYCDVGSTGNAGMAASGWFQLITSSGGTPPSGTGNTWGFSEYFADEMNVSHDVGLTADAFGESYYYGRGSAPGWVSYCHDFTSRGNEGHHFTADGIDLKPGCFRYQVTDNMYHTGYCVSGSPMTINYCSSDLDARPSWMPADVEGYMEGNRVWDINNSVSNGSSANIGGYCGLSGQRWVNNLFWGIKQTGFTAGIYVRNEIGVDDTTGVATFGTAPTLILNNLYWGTTGAFVVGGYGVGGGFPHAYPGSVVFTQRNNVANNTTGAQFAATSADFIAAVPAVAATGDAIWLSYGAGSAFDLAATSTLIGTGVSIADLTRWIAQDISQRATPIPTNPGPYQPF